MTASRTSEEEQCGFHPGRETVDEFFPLAKVLEGTLEFAQLVHMCFVDLEKNYDHVPRGNLCRVVQEHGVDGPSRKGLDSERTGLYHC